MYKLVQIHFEEIYAAASSVHLSGRLFVRNSGSLTKCNILSLGDDTVTKLGL